MGTSVILPIIIFILIGIVAIFAVKHRQKEIKKTGKYPEGHWMSRGIAIGIPLGIPIGVAMGNIALGPAIGVVIGVAIGAALKSKNNIRP
jgi:heme/copper-type cytochrome/quinol oxidase subunit 2